MFTVQYKALKCLFQTVVSLYLKCRLLTLLLPVVVYWTTLNQEKTVNYQVSRGEAQKSYKVTIEVREGWKPHAGLRAMADASRAGVQLSSSIYCIPVRLFLMFP